MSLMSRMSIPICKVQVAVEWSTRQVSEDERPIVDPGRIVSTCPTLVRLHGPHTAT